MSSVRLENVVKRFGKVVAVEEPFRVPLEGRFMRWIGRLAGRIYPILYKWKTMLGGCPSPQGVPDV